MVDERSTMVDRRSTMVAPAVDHARLLAQLVDPLIYDHTI